MLPKADPISFQKDESALRGAMPAGKDEKILPRQEDAQQGARMSMLPTSLQIGVNVLASPDASAEEQRNIALAQAFIRTLYSQKGITTIQTLCEADADFTSSGFPFTRLAEYISTVSRQLRQLPDLHVINIDFVIAKGDSVALHLELAGTNTGEPEDGLATPTFRHACFTAAMIIAVNRSSGKIHRVTLEYDRTDARRQLGWPIEPPKGATVRRGGDGQMLLVLTQQQRDRILQSPSLFPLQEGNQERESQNLATVRKYFQGMFHRKVDQTEAQRIEAMAACLDPAQHAVWVTGFPETDLLQHAINAGELTNLVPNMRIVKEGGFAKGDLVVYSFSCSGTFTRPATFLGQKIASNGEFAFVCHTFSVMRDQKMRALVCTWPSGSCFGELGQFGLRMPGITHPPYVPMAERLGLRHEASCGGAQGSPRERHNAQLVERYVRLIFGTDMPTLAQTHELMDPNGTYVCASLPTATTADEHHKHVFERLFPLLRTRKLMQIERLFCKNDIVVCVNTASFVHDGAPFPLPDGSQIAPSNRLISLRFIGVFRVGETQAGQRKILTHVEEYDAIAGFEALGWPVDPSLRQPRMVGDEFDQRWMAALHSIKQGAQLETSTPEERMAVTNVQEFLRICFDRSNDRILAAVQPLLSVGPVDRLHVSGFPFGSHREFAANMAMMNMMFNKGGMRLDASLALASGSDVVLLLQSQSVHSGADYFGFPPTHKEILFSAIMVSSVDEHQKLVESYGEWAAVRSFRYDGPNLPLPIELVPANRSTGIAPTESGFDPRVHTIAEQHHVRQAVDFLQRAFTIAGPPPALAARRTQFWPLLSPFLTADVQLQGGGFGFTNRARDYLSCWSLELLACWPDARLTIDSVLARGQTVSVRALFECTHSGAAFRGIKPSNTRAAVHMHWEFDFGADGRISKIISLGNDERLADALGLHLSAISMRSSAGGVFSTPFEGVGSVAEERHMPLVNMHLVPLRFSRTGGALGVATFSPGWSWTQHIKPIVKTDWCMQSHYGFVLQGSMTIVMKDGTRKSISKGQAFFLPPGHDGMVDGQTPFVCTDLTGFETYGICASTPTRMGSSSVAQQQQQAGQSQQSAPPLLALPLTIKSFASPDEKKELPGGIGSLSILKFGDNACITLARCKPGWRWSQHVKPLMGTEWCEHDHVSVVCRGRQTVEAQRGVDNLSMKPRVQADGGHGRLTMLEVQAGHDAWVEGEEEAEVYDFNFN